MNAKKKGNKGENAWASWLRLHGIKAWKDSASGAGTWEKGDVGNNIDAHFEVKTVKKLNLQDAWKQATAGAGNYATPYVIIHFDRMENDEWLIVMSNHDWLKLLKKYQEPKTAVSLAENKAIRWKLQNLIKSAREVLREVE